jgi:hypothetical protein
MPVAGRKSMPTSPVSLPERPAIALISRALDGVVLSETVETLVGRKSNDPHGEGIRSRALATASGRGRQRGKRRHNQGGDTS